MPNFGSSRLGYWFNQAPTTPNISNKCEINVIIDRSGSMDSTVPPLRYMLNNELKNALLGFYGSQTNYNARSIIKEFTDEQTFLQLGTPRRLSDSELVINILFQDESTTYYADGYGYWQTGPTGSFMYNWRDDWTYFRSALSSSPIPNYNVIMVVDGYSDFSNFMRYVQYGLGLYTNPYNAKDLYDAKTYNVLYGISASGTSTYYFNKIKEALAYFNIKI